jgi:hypothetical protein
MKVVHCKKEKYDVYIRRPSNEARQKVSEFMSSFKEKNDGKEERPLD